MKGSSFIQEQKILLISCNKKIFVTVIVRVPPDNAGWTLRIQAERHLQVLFKGNIRYRIPPANQMIMGRAGQKKIEESGCLLEFSPDIQIIPVNSH